MPDKEKTTYRLRLKAGRRVEADRAKPVLGPDGRPILGRFQQKVVNAGQEFDSPEDLSRKEPARYELVGGGEQAAELVRTRTELEDARARIAELEAKQPPPTLAASTVPAQFPGGQVSSGLPAAAGRSQRPMTAEEAAQHGGPAYEAPKQAPQKQADDGLDEKTVAELREEAAAREVDLHGAKSKDDILKRLRG